MTRGRARERGGSKNVVLLVAAVLFIRISIGIIGGRARMWEMMMMGAKHVTKASSARLCFITL